MAEKKTELVGFQVKKSEKDRMNAVVDFLDITKSEFLRETILREVDKIEKKMS